MDVLIQDVRNAPSGTGCKHVEITVQIGGRTFVQTFPVADFVGEPDDPLAAFTAARAYLIGRTVKL